MTSIPAGGPRVVLKVDMLVGKTDVPAGMSYRQAARKAVAMCVSDFAAKGVAPDSFMISLGLPKGTSEERVDELALGFQDASREWDVNLIGGDTNEARDLVIDCVLVGFSKGYVRRVGARPGEIVVASGSFGYPPSGLMIMIGGAKPSARFRRRAVASVTTPTPNLKVGQALAGHLTSSMDSSDGLAITLHTLAEMNNVGITVDRLPVERDVENFSRANGVRSDELVLFGGEEYLIVGTLKRRDYGRARRAARAAGGDLLALGVVTGDRGQVLLRAGSRTEPIKKKGWIHLT